jgi:hypothetical protein
MRGKFGDAAKRLGAALAFFSAQPEVYRSDGSLALAELYLGVALCNSMEESGQLVLACESIRSGLAGGARIPIWLVRSTIDSLSLGRSDLVGDVAADLLAADGAALDELLASAAGPSTPALASALFSRAAGPHRRPDDRAADYRRVIPLLLSHASSDAVARAVDALEYLEQAAVRGTQRSELLAFLSEANNYSPAWNADRAAEAKVRVLESEGRYGEAADVLERLGYELLALREPYAIDDADLLVGHIESYGPDCAVFAQRLAGHVDAQRRSLEGDGIEEASASVSLRILVVGGNETQARMDTSIRATLSEVFPKVEVDFLHSGWSGNWKPHADDFDRRVQKADGVVMLSLMRTMFGRTVRQSCPVPWRGCRGKGQGQIIEAIRRLIPLAVRFRARFAEIEG